jgi:hypothetical protein
MGKLAARSKNPSKGFTCTNKSNGTCCAFCLHDPDRRKHFFSLTDTVSCSKSLLLVPCIFTCLSIVFNGKNAQLRCSRFSLLRHVESLASWQQWVTCLSRVSGGALFRVAAMRDPLSLQLSEPGLGGREIRSLSGTILLPRAPVERRKV